LRERLSKYRKVNKTMKDFALDMRPSIRTARLGEKDSLEALQRRSALNNSGDRAALLANPDAIDLPARQIIDGCVYVAEFDRELVGFAAVLARDDEAMELDGLFVEPHLWRRGIGRALVEHCSARARECGATFLTVLGNRHAEAFYVSCGFKATGTENRASERV